VHARGIVVWPPGPTSKSGDVTEVPTIPSSRTCVVRLKGWLALLCSAVVATAIWPVRLAAHNGPPFPVITNRAVGNYVVSLWADPDASDAGDADGRFWVMVSPVSKATTLPADTVVQISVWPVDHRETVRTQTAEPDVHEPSRRAAVFVIDHEGKFGVKATIAGTLGSAEVDAVVDAQYDARPQPMLITIFALPFVLVGFVWLKLLWRRRTTKVGTA
jgi:hypothetical protein